MSDPKNVERITNDDGSQLKIVADDDKIVVHEKDAEGNTTGHVTNCNDNSGVHVHDEKGDRWESGNNPNTGESNPSPVNGINENGEVETYD